LEGDVQVELYTGDIPSVFDRFSELIGAQHWKKRVDLLKADIKGNKLLREHLFQENEFAFGLQAATELTKKYGRLPVHQMDISPLYPCMAFAAQILSITESSESTQRTQLVRRVHGALKNPDDLRGLRLELTAATHFLWRGLDVQWPELTGGGTMDLVIQGLEFCAVVAAVLTLDWRMQGNFMDRRKLAESVVRHVLSDSRQLSGLFTERV
jgi:hypothetical protein